MAADESIPSPARLAAGGLALVGLAGLVLQTIASTEMAGSVPAALWAMLRFFTIISNLLTCALFTAIALGRHDAFAPRRLAGIAVIMGLVGLVYATLLRNIEHPAGLAQAANLILHYAVPLLVALYWLLFAPRGHLRAGDPFRWALVPVIYLPYALLRAGLDGRYAYPFIDVGRLGWTQVALNAAGLAAAFLIAGEALVWLDRRLARR